MKTLLEAHVGQLAVLDTDSNWIYIGRLEAVSDDAVRLADADVHHRHDSPTTAERYVMDARATGVQTNRGTVFVSLRRIVSFSPLEEVIRF